MFPAFEAHGIDYLGFPRIRGDVPATPSQGSSTPPFSPHTRGCSAAHTARTALGSVFPAYAGMFRRFAEIRQIHERFPRIRGDVPHHPYPLSPVTLFSPHTRGCSYHTSIIETEVPVFPAYAGMFRPPAPRFTPPNGFHCIRGDVPSFWVTPRATFWFSPHMRGCSVAKPGQMYVLGVFPEYAGMFRWRLILSPR